MALPIAGWALVTAIAAISGGTAVALYQIKGTVESVTEIFTDENSALNNVAFQAIIGAGAVFAFTKLLK